MIDRCKNSVKPPHKHTWWSLSRKLDLENPQKRAWRVEADWDEADALLFWQRRRERADMQITPRAEAMAKAIRHETSWLFFEEGVVKGFAELSTSGHMWDDGWLFSDFAPANYETENLLFLAAAILAMSKLSCLRMPLGKEVSALVSETPLPEILIPHAAGALHENAPLFIPMDLLIFDRSHPANFLLEDEIKYLSIRRKKVATEFLKPKARSGRGLISYFYK